MIPSIREIKLEQLVHFIELELSKEIETSDSPFAKNLYSRIQCYKKSELKEEDEECSKFCVI